MRKRIVLLVTVATAMAAMGLVQALPAIAGGESFGTRTDQACAGGGSCAEPGA